MKHYIFADESNTDKSRFMLIGGIWVDELTYQAVRQECINFKADNNWESLQTKNESEVDVKTTYLSDYLTLNHLHLYLL